jgi:membrane associated rhomboid family serine protease
MSWINWLEARIGFLGVPRLMQLVAVLNGLVYLLSYFQRSYVNALQLNPERILHGEVWRLVSYIFIPQVLMSGGNPSSQPLSVVFLFVYLWFVVWMGDALEHAWGAFRVTLFYFLGMVGVTVAAFFFGGDGVSALLLNSSLFFAFATLYPDVQIYVFFILPLKVKWLAFFSLALLLMQLFGGPLSTKLAIVVSFLNYFVFFGPATYAKVRDRTAADIRKRKFENKPSAEETLHRCAVCKRTEKDSPELEFRVSRNGEEYCLDHLPK